MWRLSQWRLMWLVLFTVSASGYAKELRVGTSLVDVTAVEFPVLVNGGMTSRSATSVKTPQHARALVLDDGQERLAIVVVDSCMMSRPVLDEAKQLAAQRTKIRPERMLISATHTHTAPASMGCLGTDADPKYVPYLRLKLAEAIAQAEANLEPARVGWGVGNAAEYTALRRWIRRPDRVEKDPFGNPTVRANMHAGRVWEDVTGESGPEDPDLQLIAFQTRDGRPLAVLANFSMHYFGDGPPLSADYFGLFCNGLRDAVQHDLPADKQPFLALLSHGCSGDIWRRDYKVPAADWKEPTIDAYTAGLLQIALDTYRSIQYSEQADLAMSETRLNLKYRVPDQQRLEWAQRIVEQMGDRLPKDTTEVYAREQVLLHERQQTEIVVQAVRIGEIAIATTPNETYALTGIKLKLQSPLPKTMVIELANGGDGYIPPPEQHLLGGYNTWAARSAGLEVQAERKIVGAALEQLEKVAGKPRRPHVGTQGPAVATILQQRPVAYWRLDELAGPRAVDLSGRHHDGIYEPGVVFFLEGPVSQRFASHSDASHLFLNRAAHFAGGRLETRVAGIDELYSVSLWCWNGMTTDGREFAGWMFSHGHDHGLDAQSEHLGLGGQKHPAKLVWQFGDGTADGSLVAGRSELERWTWNHVVLVRAGGRARVYLNGAPDPELDVAAPATTTVDRFFFGGRTDNVANWEGRLDEIALFDRALSVEEIKQLAGSGTP